MSTEHPENTTQLKSLSKAFDQSHHNLFDNIKRVYHPQQAEKELSLIRSYSKKNLNITASNSLKKQQLQRSSPQLKSPLLNTPNKNNTNEKIPSKLIDSCRLFTPSPLKISEISCFRKKMTTYHNNFIENVNNNLLATNSYSKVFQDKSNSYINSSNIAKTKSELQLFNKTQEMIIDFRYKDEFISNTNLNEPEETEIDHKRPNESMIGRLKYIEESNNGSISPNQEIFRLRNELEECKILINMLKNDINELNCENEEMKLKSVDISAQQKDMISGIVKKHQIFIEKLINDKNQLSLKCEEYLTELKKSQKIKENAFLTEMDNIKKLTSNEETQLAYTKINAEFINLQASDEKIEKIVNKTKEKEDILKNTQNSQENQVKNIEKTKKNSRIRRI